MKKALFKFGCS